MKRFHIDSETRSYWNGSEAICLNEGEWEDFFERKQKEEREGWIKLVETPLNRSEAEKRAAAL